MMKLREKKEKKRRRSRRIRSLIRGTGECPRLSVFRSNRHIWVQLIDDTKGLTLAAAGDLKFKIKNKKTKKTAPNKGRLVSKAAIAEEVGELIAKKAAEKKIVKAVFDRGGYRYRGLVRAVAEGARKGGLKF